MAKFLVLLALPALLISVMASRPGAAENLGPISEETGPAECNAGDYVSGIRCTGSYCDNITITCSRLRDGVRVHFGTWTDWVSEEQGRRECPPDHLIAGLKCQGRYCDNVSLYCVQAPRMRIYNCGDTRAVSEEQGGRLSFLEGIDKAGQMIFAIGIKCAGRYCDNISFKVCEVAKR